MNFLLNHVQVNKEDYDLYIAYKHFLHPPSGQLKFVLSATGMFVYIEKQKLMCFSQELAFIRNAILEARRKDRENKRMIKKIDQIDYDIKILMKNCLKYDGDHYNRIPNFDFFYYEANEDVYEIEAVKIAPFSNEIMVFETGDFKRAYFNSLQVDREIKRLKLER